MNKGIILAGGLGSRLWPITKTISKQLLPVFDKPLIYYSLTTLMLSNIREILIITKEKDEENYKNLLGDGSQWGISISYKIQNNPNGIPEAFILGEKFIGNSNVALILGDNIFYGSSFSEILQKTILNFDKPTIFLFNINDPSQYGVAELKNDKLIKIVEKPDSFISNWAVTGLYFYSNQVVEIAKSLKPSMRGELEISDINNYFIKFNNLEYIKLNRGFTWMDAGNSKSLLEASNFVQTVEERQGLKIACPEEIAFRMSFIDNKQLENLIDNIEQLEYSKYLKKIIEQ